MKKCGRKQKLTPEAAALVRQLRQRALAAEREGSLSALARRFNVSPNTIRAYCDFQHKREVGTAPAPL